LGNKMTVTRSLLLAPGRYEIPHDGLSHWFVTDGVIERVFDASQNALNAGDRMGIFADGEQKGVITGFELAVIKPSGKTGLFVEMNLSSPIDYDSLKPEVDFETDPQNPAIIGLNLTKTSPTEAAAKFAMANPSYAAAIAQREDEDALELAQFSMSQKPQVF
jgi:hypothetical protein